MILKLGKTPFAVANMGVDETPLIAIGVLSFVILVSKLGFRMIVAEAQVSKKRFESHKGSGSNFECKLQSKHEIIALQSSL
jgi:hypothetical protein